MCKHLLEDSKIIKIGEVILVGYINNEFPVKAGNCFSALTVDNRYIAIGNFVLENLEYLIENDLSWPVNIKIVEGTRYGIVCDKRIPEEYYKKEICTICIPPNIRKIMENINVI